MSRSRTIKPSFFNNDDLAECSPLARLLFIGLWTIADRAGRIEDRPKRIKAEILPFDDCNVDDLLTELKTRGFIIRYEAEGRRCIEVLNFVKHQRPHPKEPESELPAFQQLAVTPAEPWKVTAGPETTTASCALPSSSLHSSNPIPHTPIPRQAATRACFEEFVSLFPKKTHTDQAGEEWDRIRPDSELAAALLQAVREQSRWPDRSGDNLRFMPNPAKWLREKRWLDKPPSMAPPGPPKRLSSAERIRLKMEGKT